MHFSLRIFSFWIRLIFVLGVSFAPNPRHSVRAFSRGNQAPDPDVWSDPARQLAAKIFVQMGFGAAVSLTFRNSSTLGASEAGEAQRALRAELRRQGLRLVNSQPATAHIRMTLSENVQGLLWVAEIVPTKAGACLETVAMVALPRPVREPSARNPTNLVIRKTRVWEGHEAILDLAFLDAGGNEAPVIILLEVSNLSLLAMQNSAWHLRESIPLAQARPWPRDPRGRLVLRPDHSFEAYLPGSKCAGKILPVLSLDCRETDEGWPLGAQGEREGMVRAILAAGRNFFDGTLNLGSEMKVPPFFSAAGVRDKGNALWVFAGWDGRARLFSDHPAPVATFEGWGSDIVGVKTNCGSGWQVLASSTGDYVEPDTLRAFEIVNREAVAVSSTVEFAGPITALWPAGDGSSAVAVSWNPGTRSYEAFSLSIDCGR